MKEPIYKSQSQMDVTKVADSSIGLHGYPVIGSRIDDQTCQFSGLAWREFASHFCLGFVRFEPGH